MIVKKLSPQDWSSLAKDAHLVVFDEVRPTELDRIDYALLAIDGSRGLSAYMTCKELDAESVYWQYGGSFPTARDTTRSFKSYQFFLDWHRARYKRVGTLIENTNTVMLKMAMKVGFKITGIRYFKGSILLEHTLEFEGDK